MEDLKGINIALRLRECRKSENDIVESVIENIIIESRDIFSVIIEYQKDFMADGDKTLGFYQEAQDKLTGCYMYFAPIISVLRSLKEYRALTWYTNKKSTVEKAGEKFVDGATEKESKQTVSEIAYALSVFEGYQDSCKQSIMTCRSRMKEQIDTE